MAKSRGILKVQGTIGGMTFYQANGKDLIKEANGPSKERIKNDPNFKRTRENNQEFGGSAMAAKMIRMGLVQTYQVMADNTCGGRLVRLCREVIAQDVGLRGQRSFDPVTYKPFFQHFPLSNTISLDSILLAPYTVVASADRKHITVELPSFDAANFVHAPAGATHFRIVATASVLSKLLYISNLNKYEAEDKTNASKNKLVASDYFGINDETGALVTLTASLDDVDVLPSTSAVMACIGIEFYQAMSGRQYLLASGNAMKIAQVF